MLFSLFHKVQKEGIRPNTFYEARIAPILKPCKYTSKKKKVIGNIPNEHRCEILNKIFADRIQQ
jgi:hypothetical protein